MPQVDRRAACVPLFDGEDGLMLRGIDPRVPDVHFWFTPGGGGEPVADLLRQGPPPGSTKVAS